jgi:hypothetical protein
VPVDNTYREVVVHGNREFQRYALEHGIYFAPAHCVVVEQDEIDRLQYMHGIFNMMFDNRLIFPPVPRPRRILECGSGSGAWAMEVAEQYPECEVGEITPVGVALVLLVRARRRTRERVEGRLPISNHHVSTPANSTRV